MARKKSKANYFTQETEDYIVKYNNSDDYAYRDRIFSKHIHHPLYKLAENIIHTFKFYYLDTEEIEDLKHQIISVIVEEKIMKFDPTYGAKAYSYFGTIIKRWLINYNNKNFKRLKRESSFEIYEESYELDTEVDNTYTKTLSLFIDEWVEECYRKLDTLFTKDKELQIADAVLTIFKKRQDLEILKKKALYIYIRNITECETPQLTRVVSVLKQDFKDKYQRLLELGLLSNNTI